MAPPKALTPEELQRVLEEKEREWQEQLRAAYKKGYEEAAREAQALVEMKRLAEGGETIRACIAAAMEMARPFMPLLARLLGRSMGLGEVAEALSSAAQEGAEGQG